MTTPTTSKEKLSAASATPRPETSRSTNSDGTSANTNTTNKTANTHEVATALQTQILPNHINNSPMSNEQVIIQLLSDKNTNNINSAGTSFNSSTNSSNIRNESDGNIVTDDITGKINSTSACPTLKSTLHQNSKCSALNY